MKALIPFLLILSPVLLGAQALSYGAADVTVEPREDGYHLFIRKKPGVSSVLLTESFELPDHSLSSFAYRAFEKNEVNGNETRVLDGRPLKNSVFSLIDSTVESSSLWPEGAFHILIPPRVQYGYPDYPNSRYKAENVGALALQPDQKFWFSIRAFSKPYGDYSGAYQDNAFELFSYVREAAQMPPPPDKGLYQPKLEESFDLLSEKTVKATGPEDLLKQIESLLSAVPGDSLDLILVLDTTKSMIDEMPVIKAGLMDVIKKQVSRFSSWRMASVYYRDYMEEYLNRLVDFQTDFEALQRDLNRVVAGGGGDVPEAVLEALYAGANGVQWQAAQRLMILVGDAPAHDLPRGRITKDMVDRVMKEKGITVVSILMPYSEP